MAAQPHSFGSPQRLHNHDGINKRGLTMRRFTTISKAIAVYLLCVSQVLSETLPLQRVDSGEQVVWPLSTYAYAYDLCKEKGFDDPEPSQPAADPTFASAAISSSASASANTRAVAQTGATAMVNAAPNAVLYLGQADTSAIGQAGASADECGVAYSWWNTPGVSASATFQVLGTSSYPTGPANATEIVTIAVGGGIQPLPAGAELTVTAGQTTITAESLGSLGWWIHGQRSTSSTSNPNSPPEQISLMAPPEGFSITIVGTELTGVGATLAVSAQMQNLGQDAYPDIPSNWTFSATAVVYVETP